MVKMPQQKALPPLSLAVKYEADALLRRDTNESSFHPTTEGESCLGRGSAGQDPAFRVNGGAWSWRWCL